jgi:nicotinamidase-related amidase
MSRVPAGKPPSGPGFPLGALKDTDGTTIDGGDLYIEGSWNVELYGPLKDLYEESQGNKINPDVVLHKKWMYGSPQLDAFLQERGIKSLMFGGFNTEQCV